MMKTETIGDNRYRVDEDGNVNVTEPNSCEFMLIGRDGISRAIRPAAMIVEAYRLQQEWREAKRKVGSDQNEGRQAPLPGGLAISLSV